jgi:hypothetical protein
MTELGHIGKDSEGSGRDLMEVLFRHLPTDTEKTTKYFSRNTWCFGV